MARRFTETPYKIRRHACLYGGLDRDWCFDRWMWIVAGELEIFEFEAVDVFDLWIQFHARQWPEITGKLLVRLVEMVFVKMEIAERVNEIARREIDDLRHHHCEQ